MAIWKQKVQCSHELRTQETVVVCSTTWARQLFLPKRLKSRLKQRTWRLIVKKSSRKKIKWIMSYKSCCFLLLPCFLILLSPTRIRENAWTHDWDLRCNRPAVMQKSPACRFASLARDVFFHFCETSVESRCKDRSTDTNQLQVTHEARLFVSVFFPHSVNI